MAFNPIGRADNNKYINPVFSIVVDYQNCTNCSIPQADNSTVGRGKNSRFRYTLSQTVFLDHTSKLSIGSISIPYSWRNITSALGNNTFSYVFNGMTRVVTVPDGFYSLVELYAYLQSVMVMCGDYLVNPASAYVYFLELAYNTPVYRIQFNSYAITYPLASGWTVPSTWGGSINNSYVTSSGTPTISSATITGGGSGTLANAYMIIPYSATTTRNLYDYFGLTYATSPYIPYQCYNAPGTSTVSQLGDKAPRQSFVDSLVLTSPQIKNMFTSNQNNVPTNVISCIQINTTYGNNISLAQFFTTWMPFATNSIKYLDFIITDQEGNDVFLEDLSTTMELIITNAQ